MKTYNQIPKIPALISNGWISKQRVRCGKSNCRCSRGDPHTGYYFFTRVDGKLTKRYIRAADVEAFRAILEATTRDRRLRRERRKESRQQLRSLTRQLREIDSSLAIQRKTVNKTRSKGNNV
jgi:hypothetical protein